jgi:hypothetical protein
MRLPGTTIIRRNVEDVAKIRRNATFSTGCCHAATLTFYAVKDGKRADDALTAAIEGHRSPVDETVDVAIGLDPEYQHARFYAADAFVDGYKPPWNITFDRGEGLPATQIQPSPKSSTQS